jgi:hypothetical protein
MNSSIDTSDIGTVILAHRIRSTTQLEKIMNSHIKSITTTQHAGQWVCRVRFAQGGEQFIGVGANYTMHQAEALTQHVRRDVERRGSAVLDQYVAS